MRLVLFLILVIASFEMQAQFKILLLSGDSTVIRNYKYNETGTAITYRTQDREIIELDLSNIYSITDTLNNVQIIYKPDSAKEDYMTAEQMKFFIKGEVEADRRYKCKWCLIGGFAVGVTSPFLLLPIMSTTASAATFSPLIPAATSSIVGFSGAPLKKIRAMNPEMAKNEHYVIGFKERSQQIRLKSTIIGSGLGLLVGIITAFVVVK